MRRVITAGLLVGLAVTALATPAEARVSPLQRRRDAHGRREHLGG